MKKRVPIKAAARPPWHLHASLGEGSGVFWGARNPQVLLLVPEAAQSPFSMLFRKEGIFTSGAEIAQLDPGGGEDGQQLRCALGAGELTLRG